VMALAIGRGLRLLRRATWRLRCYDAGAFESWEFVDVLVWVWRASVGGG